MLNQSGVVANTIAFYTLRMINYSTVFGRSANPYGEIRFAPSPGPPTGRAAAALSSGSARRT